MKKYVLSSKDERGSPIGIISEGSLYDKFYDGETALREKRGTFPWNKDNRGCSLPVGAIFITKSKSRYTFGIRKYANSLYVVSENFLKVMIDLQVRYEGHQAIEILNSKGEPASEGNYFLVRILSFKFDDVIDEAKSKFVNSDDGVVLKKISVKKEFLQPLFLVDQLIGQQSTLFCSESFRDAAVKYEIKGVNFFEEAKANWQSGVDFLMNMGGGYAANTVWPI